jgi:hypothetical protein
MRWTRWLRLTSAARRGRRRRVVLAPRCWRQVLRRDPRSDGGKKAGHRGGHDISRKPLRREGRSVSAEPVCSCALSFVHFAHETAGAARTRSSLRPLCLLRGPKQGKPRTHRAARMRTHMPRRLKIESKVRDGASKILHRRPGPASGSERNPEPITPGANCLGQMLTSFLRQPRPVVMGPGAWRSPGRPRKNTSGTRRPPRNRRPRQHFPVPNSPLVTRH